MMIAAPPSSPDLKSHTYDYNWGACLHNPRLPLLFSPIIATVSAKPISIFLKFT